MSAPEIMEEQRLLSMLRAGSYEAFEVLYDRYNRPLMGNFIKLLKSNDLAAESLQELFIRLWNNRDKIDPEKPIKSYLFRIAENMVIDIFRRAARDKEMRNYFLDHMHEAYEHIERHIDNKEYYNILHNAIEKLPPQRKLVFKLCKLEEKTYKEVSEILGISQAAVNDHITKANAYLKEYFATNPVQTLLIAATLLAHIQN